MSYYRSRFNTEGVSFYSSDYSPRSRTYSYSSGYGDRPISSYASSRPNFGTRARNRPGSHKMEYNELFFKYRHYAPADNNPRDEGPRVLKLELNMEENRKAHRTHMYSEKSLIVRRGQEFSVELEIKVPFDKNADTIQFLLAKGEKPQETKGTLVRLKVHNGKKEAETGGRSADWKAYISSINNRNVGAVVSIVIKPSASALIGKYKITSKVFGRDLTDKSRRFLKEEEVHLIVLFNPWCKEDQVYMPNAAECEEYVMNETGRIWVGSATQYRGRPWAFSQFSRHCLGAALHLLDNCYLKAPGHGNATTVSRALSAMANSCDNPKGVLTGNWSGNYLGGTSPTEWTGSEAILKEYMLSKRAVSFGQCWVFSGLLTTLGRTLGIPTRSVTNFASAHDSDNSLSIDTHFDYEGKSLKELNDSTWNFHVWNESWFKRPDLPDGYDGWQAYDATPQEESEGMMRCGPAPIKAIKEGNVYLGFDTKFIFAEVNGDAVTWFVMPDGELYPIKHKTDVVGKAISTKAVGVADRLDVTLNYKYPEGSEQERQAVARASQFSSRAEELDRLYREGVAQDVEFKYESPVSKNGDIHIKVTATNTSKEVRHCKMRFSTHAVYYTGVIGTDLYDNTFDMVLQAGQSEVQTFDLESKNYLNIIDQDAKIKEFVTCTVQETNQFYQEDEIFHIEKPDLDMKVSNKKPKVGESLEVTLSFENPLEINLTQNVISIEGPGLQKRKKIPLNRTIKPGEKMTHTVTLTTKYPGKRELIACFNSRQLIEVTGVVEIEVQP